MVGKMMLKIRKLLTNIWIRLHERKYSYEGKNIKYILLNNKSDYLCVCFAGFPPLGSYPIYNYIRTLKGIKKANYLFLLDDMVNIRTGGGYYLGNRGYYWGLEAVPNMINSFKDRLSAKKIITLGSSKGGSCALLFGAKVVADCIISGACQYKIGTYLNCPYHIASLRELTGEKDTSKEVSKESIEQLDSLIYTALKENRNIKNTKIWLHYSNQEHTFFSDIKFLVDDLKKLGYNVSEDIRDYQEHGDVGLYFPTYMRHILESL